MQQNNPNFFIKLAAIVGVIVIFIIAGHWFNINWGRLEQGTPATITVTGMADDNQINQIATFRAGAEVSDVSRETAVEQANSLVADLIAQVKNFGIPAEDIQTENLNVYEYTEPREVIMIAPATGNSAGVSAGSAASSTDEKMWRASNTIVITLRDASQASDLATLLTNAGATTVSGPSFAVDDTTDIDQQLLQEAMQDARDKAATLLAGSGQKITRIVNIYENESYNPYPMYRESAVSALDSSMPVPVEPGSTNVTKSVTVVFEISR